MVVSICLAVMCLLQALYLALGLNFDVKHTPAERKGSGFGMRTVVKGEFVPAPPLDLEAVRGFRKILATPVYPSARLVESMTEAERRALERFGAARPVVLAKATHPSRRGGIRNLIAACRDEFFVVVAGRYTEGLILRNGAFAESFPERFAAFTFDGVLSRNPQFMLLARAAEGVTVNGKYAPLPAEPFRPVLAAFDYALDVASFGFGIRTHGAASLVWRPASPPLSVRAARGNISIRCRDGDILVRTQGCAGRARLVALESGVGVRINVSGACEILVGTERPFAELFAAHAAFCAKNTLLRFQADPTSERLYEVCMETIYRCRLHALRAHRIASLKELAAVLASGFDSLDGFAVCLPEEGAALGDLARLCVKSYRGVALTEDEYAALRRDAERCREQGGLYRAAAFKLMGLAAPYYRRNPNFASLHYSLVADTDELLACFDSASPTERAVFGALLAGRPAPDVETMLAHIAEFGEFGVIAAYLYLRATLVGVKLKYGALLCEPTLATLRSIDLADRHIEIGRDAEGGIVVGGIRLHTAALPRNEKQIELKISDM